MNIPFTPEQFFGIFEKYNLAVFPAQILILIIGAACLLLIHSSKPYKDKLIVGFLGLLWLWIGIVYHLSFFTEINKAAYVFGGLFIIQGVLFLAYTFIGNRFTFTFNGCISHYIGYFFIIFGLIIYPVIGYLINKSAVHTISLGLPCPSTIFTFGLLILAGSKMPRYLLIIPSLWAIVGSTAAIKFGVYQDIMLLLSALVALFIIRKYSRA